MRNWLIDLLSGVTVGGMVGAVAAINFVIFIGMDDGYEASIADVFRQNLTAGSMTVTILVLGPLLGVIIARRMRRKRDQRIS